MCGILAQKYRTSWSEVADVIRTEVSARCAAMMEPFFSEMYPAGIIIIIILIICEYLEYLYNVTGSTNIQLDRLAKLLARFKTAQHAISELRTLSRHLAAVGVLPKAFIDLSLVYHPG